MYEKCNKAVLVLKTPKFSKMPDFNRISCTTRE